MLLFLPVLCALADVALAASPAKATYCSEDNLLRAFQHTPTPAGSYCQTATGYPTFLKPTAYPATRLSSACSCFSRFPTEPVSTPACKADTLLKFQGVSATQGIAVNLLLTINLNQACSTGSAVTNICGTLAGQLVTFNPANHFSNADNCYFPSIFDVSGLGVAFSTPADTFVLYESGGAHRINSFSDGDEYDFVHFLSVECGSADAACPS